ncbi:MAG: AAA family ATPase, partial [Bacteroidales bacterium]|nr:AAA family ATPase [Bacteroidales bacterium]
MYIKNIQLRNYRNYEHLDLDLGKKTTVLIGKNGSGKTNMISAMKQALSFIFRREKGTPQYDFLASLDQSIKSFSQTDPRYIITQNGVDYNYPVLIKTTMSMQPINDTNGEDK